MATIQELRQKYPQYSDMSDMEFADRFHDKFYNDMPKDQFYQKIGFSSNTSPPPQSQTQPVGADKERLKRHLENVIGINSTPFNQVRDVLSGVATSGQNIANALTGNRGTQYNFSAENTNPILMEIGKYLPALIAGGPGIIGQMISQGAQGAANTQPGEQNAFGFLPEGRLGGAIENSLLVGAPMSIGKGLKYLKRSKTPQEIAKQVQSSHDLLEKEANNIFNHVGEEAQKRGITNIPIDEKLIEKISKYLPDTKASKNLINNLKSNDYFKIRKAQSDLWHKGQTKKASILDSERDIGDEILDLRDEVNESVSKNFQNTKHADLNHLLNKAKGKYKDLKEIYYGDEVPRSIKKLVGKKSRKMLKNVNVLKEESIPLNKIRELSPDIKKDIKFMEDKKNVVNRAKKVGWSLAGLAGIDWMGHKINNLLK